MRRIVSIWVILLILASSLPAGALAAGGSGPDPASPPRLHLLTGAVDPTSLMTLASLSPVPSGQKALYVVQFHDVITSADHALLQKAGVLVGPYLPDFAFVVQATPEQAQSLAQDGRVRAVVRFRPEWKVSPEAAAATGEVSLRVQTFPGAGDQPTTLQTGLKATSAESDSTGLLLNGVQASAVQELAADESVLFVDLAKPIQLFNERARGILIPGGGLDSVGLTGTGQVVAVADSGLDTGNLATLHPDFQGQVKETFGIGRPGEWSDYDGHGTHVTGSVLGTGAASNGAQKGMAPGAQLVMQSLSDTEGGLVLPPEGLPALFEQARLAGAQLHTNSWGYSTTAYESEATAVDDYTWLHKDFTILFAAGNAGPYSGTVSTPGTAKNAITVGASENNRPDSDYGSLADDPNEMADFSSRGPAEDGRVKPDVVAPGMAILSTRSSLSYPENSGYYQYMSGTSMATPLTAGAAALVREYLQTEQQIANPSSALIKAMLINGAQDMGDGWMSPDQGWGRVDLTNTLYPVGRENALVMEQTGLATSESTSYTYDLREGQILKITLVWTDYPGAPNSAKNLVNDLDLQVTGPSGQVYQGNCFTPDRKTAATTACGFDRVNNVENVYIAAPTSGQYTVNVAGYNVPNGPQPYALVVSGLFSSSSAPAVQLTSPLPSASLRGEVTLTAKVQDADPIERVEFYRDSTPLGTDTNGTDGWSLAWDTTNVPNRAYFLTARAYDSGGNVGASMAIAVKVEKPMPELSLIAPAYVGVGESFTLEVSVAGGADLYGSAVELLLDPSAFEFVSATSGTLVPGDLASDAVFQGMQQVEVDGGLQRITALALRLGDQFGASGDGTIATFSLKSIGQGSFIIDPAAMLKVQLVDSTGAPLAFGPPAPVTIKVDDMVPKAVHVVGATKLDPTGVAHYMAGDEVEIRVEAHPGLLSASAENQPWIYAEIPGIVGASEIALAETAAGIYEGSYVVSAGDNTGEPVSVTATVVSPDGTPHPRTSDDKVVLDTTPPTYEALSTTAQTVLRAGDSFRLLAIAEPGLTQVTYSFTPEDGVARTGELVDTGAYPGAYSAPYTVAEGENTPVDGAVVSMTLVDLAGNETTADLDQTIKIDTTAPVISDLVVQAANGELTISFTAEAGLTAAATVDGLFAGRPFTYENGTYLLTFDFQPGMDVSNADVTITARDAAGNETTQIVVDGVTIDTIAPYASVKVSHQPRGLEGWYVEQPSLTIIVEEGATLSLQDGGNEVTLATPTTAEGLSTYTYDVPEGEHTFAFTATDAAGNKTERTLPPMKVDTTEPAAPTDLTATLNKSERTAAVTGTISDADVTRVALWVNGQNVGIRQVAPGSFSLASIPLVENLKNEGINTIEIAAIDAAGNQGPKGSLELTLDTTPPTFGITLDSVSGTITVLASEPIASGPTLTATINGTTLAELTALQPTGNADEYAATFDPAMDLSGALKINVTGTDAAGNVGYGHRVKETVADTTQPNSVTSNDGNVTVYFEAGELADTAVALSTYLDENLHAYTPPGTQILGGAYQFSATLSDDASVDVTFQMAITGPVPAEVGIYYLPLEKPGSVELVWGTTEIVSTDPATEISIVKVHATLPHFSVWAPFVDMTAPEYVGEIAVNGSTAANQTINTTTVTISGTVDPTTAKVEVTGGSAAVEQVLNPKSTVDQSFSLSVALGADGLKTLTVKAYDEFGNWNSREISLTLDTVGPAVTGLSVNGAAYSGTVYTTSSTAGLVAGSDDATARLTVKQGESILLADAQSVNLTLNLTANAGNSYTIEAEDPVGNVTSSTVTIVNDTLAPVLTINNLPAQTGDDSFTFGYSVNEAGATVDLIADNGATYTPDTATQKITITFPADGTYTLTFTVTDPAGNKTTVTRTVLYDTAVPIVSATASPNPTTTNSTLNISAVDDASVAVNGLLSISVGGTTLVDATAFNGTGSYDLTTLTEGANPVTVEVTNLINGLTGSTSLSVTKDTTGPVVTLTAPQSTTTSGSMQVTATLNEPARIQIQRLSGATWINVGSQTSQLEAGTRSVTVSLTSGTNQYRAQATDALGNSSTSAPITITYTPPSGGGGGGGGALPTPAPTISAAAAQSLTNQATVTISGTATAGAELKIARGATLLQTLTVGESGTFSYTADLAEGENSFTLTVTNVGGSASTTVTVTRDSTAPVVTVTAPSESETAEATITVTTEAKAKVYVNSRLAGTVPNSGTLTVTVALQEGTNSISVYAVDAAGNKSGEQTATISYQPVTQPPTQPEPTTPTTPTAPVLRDMEGHWAEAAVRELVSAGILSGMGDGTFQPEASVTRAQFAKMIVLALGLEIDEAAVLNLTDADQIPAWARPYVAAAMKAGLITGYEDGSFRADQQITRLQIAVIMGRALALKGVVPTGEAKQFTDRDAIPAWATAQFDAATQAGLITGFEDGSFRPDQNATRAQAAVLTLRLLLQIK